MTRQPLEQARGAARQLMQRLRVRHPVELALEEITWLLGARIVRGELPGAHARLARLGDLAVIRVSTRIRQPGAERFTIAHELGHLALAHPTPPVLELCGATPATDGGREAEADAFAAELLLPEALVGPLCAPAAVSLDPVRTIAEHFRVSVLAAAVRFVELTPERCALVLAQDQHVRWVVRSATFRPYIPRGRRVEAGARAFALLADGAPVASAVERPVHVRATAWFDRESLDREALDHLTLVEEAFAVPDTHAVASLLWLPPDPFT